MKRRRAIAVLCALALPGALGSSALAQRAVARVAILGVDTADSELGVLVLAKIREGLVGEGLAEGRDFEVSYVPEPAIEKVPARVAELLGRKPAVLVAVTTPVALAAAKATREVPIVFSTVSDPVASGLVASLARPGGNVTGVSNMLPAITGKLLELTRELSPGVSRVAALWNPDNPAKVVEANELRAAARRFSIALEELPVRSLAEIERALAPGAKGRPGVLVILGETLTVTHRERIAALARAAGMAVVANISTHTQAGGVLSYSSDYAPLLQRVGALAGKIVKGAKPGALAVELPAKFVLLVNLRAAKAHGLAVPQSILLRADRVIE